MDSEWVRLIVSVLSGLAATIPLVIQLVQRRIAVWLSSTLPWLV